MKTRKHHFLIRLVADYETNEVIDVIDVDPDLVTDFCIETCDNVNINCDLGITYIMDVNNEQWINEKLYLKSDVQLRNEKINRIRNRI